MDEVCHTSTKNLTKFEDNLIQELLLTDLESPVKIPGKKLRTYLSQKGIICPGETCNRERLIALFRKNVLPSSVYSKNSNLPRQQQGKEKQQTAVVKPVLLESRKDFSIEHQVIDNEKQSNFTQVEEFPSICAKMTAESDNESVHSGGSAGATVDENKGGGSELTVKIPSAKTDNRNSKPVKLNRKSFDVMPKKSDRDNRTDEQETTPSKTEVSNPSATCQTKPTNHIREKILKLLGKEDPLKSSHQQQCNTDNDKSRANMYSGAQGKSRFDKPGDNGDDEVQIIDLEKEDTNRQGMSNQDETIQVSIGSGKMRSSVVVSRCSDDIDMDISSSHESGNNNDQDKRSSAGTVDYSKHEDDIDIGREEKGDQPSSSKSDKISDSDRNSSDKKSKTVDSRKSSDSKRTPERIHRSSEKIRSSRRRDSRDSHERERSDKDRRDGSRERKRSPGRRSRSPSGRCRSDYDRRRGGSNVRRMSDRGRRGGRFDYNRGGGRFGSSYRGGRGVFTPRDGRGGNSSHVRRFPDRNRSDRARTPERRRRDSRGESPSSKERHRSRSDERRKKEEAKKKSKPTKEEIEKMEEELKKIDLMIEIRKTKKKTGGEKGKNDKDADTSVESMEVVPNGGVEMDTVNRAIHSPENSARDHERTTSTHRVEESSKNLDQELRKDKPVAEKEVVIDRENTDNDYRKKTSPVSAKTINDLERSKSNRDRSKPVTVGHIEEEKEIKRAERTVLPKKDIRDIEYASNREKDTRVSRDKDLRKSNREQVINIIQKVQESRMKQADVSRQSETDPKPAEIRKESLKDSCKKNDSKGDDKEYNSSSSSDNESTKDGLEQSLETEDKDDNADDDDDDNKDQSSSDSEDDDGSGKSSSSSAASDASQSAESEEGGSDITGSESSEDSEPVKKKKLKKKKKKRSSRHSSNSDESDSGSDAESDDSEKCSRKKKKKKKKKKRKKRRKSRSSRKRSKKPDDKSIVMNESQFSAFLDKVKESLRDEIVKELHHPPAGEKEKEPTSKNSKKKEKSLRSDGPKDAVDSLDELELEMSTHHGFPTGIPLRKDESEIVGSKSTETTKREKEEIFDVFKSDDDLDNELDSDNWKRKNEKGGGGSSGTGEKSDEDRRTKNKEGSSKRDKDSNRFKHSSRSEHSDCKKQDLVGKNDKTSTKQTVEDFEKSRKDDKDRKRTLDSNNERSTKDDSKKRGRLDESKDVPRDKKVYNKDDKVDEDRERRGSNKASPKPPKDFPFTAKEIMPSPVDGITIATQVREDVYKSNDFWNGSAKKRPMDIDSAPSAIDDSKRKEGIAQIETTVGRWEAPFSSDINNRLAKLADAKYPSSTEEHGTKKHRKSVDSEKIDEKEKRTQSSKHEDDKTNEKDSRNRLESSGTSSKHDKNDHRHPKPDRNTLSNEQDSYSTKQSSGDRERERIDDKDASKRTCSNERRNEIPSRRDSSRDRNNSRRDSKERYKDNKKDDYKERKDDYKDRKDDNKDRKEGRYRDDFRATKDNSRSKGDSNEHSSSKYSRNDSHSHSDKSTRSSHYSNNSWSKNEQDERYKSSKKSSDKNFSSASSDSSDTERNRNKSKNPESYTRPEKHYRGSAKKKKRAYCMP